MKLVFQFGLVACFVFVFTCYGQQYYYSGKVTVQVMDEDGNAINNADVLIAFQRARDIDNPWAGTKSVSCKGKSDVNGLFIGSNKECLGWVSLHASKMSYYDNSYKRYSFEKFDQGQWQPWNPTVSITLKKKINPIPMYARRVDTEIPILDKPVGYDLKKGDWVMPYGQGDSNDIFFTVEREYQDNHNFKSKMTMEIPEEGNGFRPVMTELETPWSEYRFPLIAPVEGYGNTIYQIFNAGSDIEGGHQRLFYPKDCQNYFIRTRTKADGDGNLVRADYGLLVGPINYFLQPYSETATIRFKYYLNTDGTPNIEFDPERNLLKLERREIKPNLP